MSEYRSDLYDCTLLLAAETPLAWGVKETEDDEKLKWLPKSQCERNDRKHPTKPIYEFTIPMWLVEKLDLI